MPWAHTDICAVQLLLANLSFKLPVAFDLHKRVVGSSDKRY